KQKFKSMLEEIQGMTFNQWNELLGGACPVGSIRNPRLFHGNKILAGTLSGVIDPFLFFGMLGALVSGRIASTAIVDKEKAWQDFKRATRTFYSNFVAKKIWDALPDSVRRPLGQTGLRMMPAVEDIATKIFARNIPGWRLTE
ncbi:MAG: hypothetical protein PHP64_08090, partial [Actinomycetota bacterium]|nr:hypothetical protein [Actinomycetota bacterium]